MLDTSDTTFFGEKLHSLLQLTPGHPKSPNSTDSTRRFLPDSIGYLKVRAKKSVLIAIEKPPLSCAPYSPMCSPNSYVCCSLFFFRCAFLFWTGSPSIQQVNICAACSNETIYILNKLPILYRKIASSYARYQYTWILIGPSPTDDLFQPIFFD